MPLYEYECTKCGHRAEVIQRVGATSPGRCGECGGEMRRLLSAPAFQFKGTGWYVTDYARKGSSSDQGSPGAEEGKSGKDKDSSDKKDKKDKKADTASTSKTAKAS